MGVSGGGAVYVVGSGGVVATVHGSALMFGEVGRAVAWLPSFDLLAAQRG